MRGISSASARHVRAVVSSSWLRVIQKSGERFERPRFGLSQPGHGGADESQQACSAASPICAFNASQVARTSTSAWLSAT